MFVWPSYKLWRIFGNLRKVVGNLGKIVKNAVISMSIQYKEHYKLARRYEFMFSWQEQYCSCHSNIKFISSRHRVISSISILGASQDDAIFPGEDIFGARYFQAKALDVNFRPYDKFRRNQNGPFHLISGRNFWNLWHNVLSVTSSELISSGLALQFMVEFIAEFMVHGWVHG